MKSLKEIIGTAIGKASMQWNPRPKGVFDSTEAVKLTDRTYKKIRDAGYVHIDELEIDEEKLFIPILKVLEPDIAYVCRPDGTIGKTFTNKLKIKELAKAIASKSKELIKKK